MNIAIEYLERHGLLKNYLTVPCSLFLKNREGQKLVVTIHQDEQEYLVSHYKVYECLFGSKLPPIDRYFVSNLFTDPNVLVAGFHLLECNPRSIPADENGYNSPMSTEMYNDFFDNIFNVDSFRRKREFWLWSAFIDIFHPQLPALSLVLKRVWNFPYRPDPDLMEEQQAVIRSNFPHDYRNWITWKTLMLDFEGVPAELAFRSSKVTSTSFSFLTDGEGLAAFPMN